MTQEAQGTKLKRKIAIANDFRAKAKLPTGWTPPKINGVQMALNVQLEQCQEEIERAISLAKTPVAPAPAKTPTPAPTVKPAALSKPVAQVSTVTIRDGFRFEKMADGSTRVDKA